MRATQITVENKLFLWKNGLNANPLETLFLRLQQINCALYMVFSKKKRISIEGGSAEVQLFLWKT